VQPITFTGVPGRSHVTSGNARSGPARMLTACVVNADCANADIGNKSSSAARHRADLISDIDFSSQGPAWAGRLRIGRRADRHAPAVRGAREPAW
jgi:hypothetical protein